MKHVFLFILTFVFLMTASVCAADPDADARILDEWLAEANRQYAEIRYSDADRLGSPLPQDSWEYRSGLVFALYNIFDDQNENSFEAARNGGDFHGIPNEWLAKDLAEAETAILLQQVSVSSTGPDGKKYSIYARLVLADAKTGEILAYSFTPAVPLTEAEKEAFNLMGVESCTQFLAEYAAEGSGTDGAAKQAGTGAADPRYEEAMALFNEEKYYSARQAFIESQYGDWEEMAAKCVRERPSAGELWHDPATKSKEISLTFRIDQPEDQSIFIRIFKYGKPVSNLFVPGPGNVTVKLPGTSLYTIRDGIGRVWYGEKEAFGREGSYETMIFDDKGKETIFLESGYEYTISINIKGSGTDIGSRREDWDSFTEE